MQLANGARVAIVGGGPAGSLTAIFLLKLARHCRLDLRVDIYEPRAFATTGPKGCNLCGGVVSESLVQWLAVEGISLPPEVILDTINAYVLHTDQDAVRIETVRKEMRIASIFRGGGPGGAEHQTPLPWASFDLFLLQLAIQKGARHLSCAVIGLERQAGFPTILTQEYPPSRAALLVGAVGINNAKSLTMFQGLNFGYVPPKTTRAYVTELYYGERNVYACLGHAMHVFLLKIPHLKFAAIVPKGHYATVVLLGNKVDQHLVERFFRAPEVRRCLPPGWEMPVQTCRCRPRINVGAPVKPFGDRVVMVGDASVSRLYKDGIGSAYRMAKRCALTAVTHGVSARHFRRYYWPGCRAMAWDNRLGHTMFFMDGILKRVPWLRQGVLRIMKEKSGPDFQGTGEALSVAFWNLFTGSASYITIAKEMFHPAVLVGIVRALGRQLKENFSNRGP